MTLNQGQLDELVTTLKGLTEVKRKVWRAKLVGHGYLSVSGKSAWSGAGYAKNAVSNYIRYTLRRLGISRKDAIQALEAAKLLVFEEISSNDYKLVVNSYDNEQYIVATDELVDFETWRWESKGQLKLSVKDFADRKVLSTFSFSNWSK